MYIEQLGIIGMGVMAENFINNIFNYKYNIYLYNRSKYKINYLLNKNILIFPCFCFKKLIYSLKKPKCIILLIKSNKYILKILNILKNILNKGDILIDYGNTYFLNTINFYKYLLKYGLYFIGYGISGGEKGALYKSIILPGGNKYIYEIFNNILFNINNYINYKYFLGVDGAGHYIKMIHNTIEYNIIELISEIFNIIKKILFYNYSKIINFFINLNNSKLNSYLINILNLILIKKNKTQVLLDFINNISFNKNTGLWSIYNALNIKIYMNIINESLYVRYISYIYFFFINNKKNIKKNIKIINLKFILKKIYKTLYLSIIIIYIQSLMQLKKASFFYHWHINFINLFKIIKKNCIIRSKIIFNIININIFNKNIKNLFLSYYIKNIINNNNNKSLRTIINYSIKNNIPIPVLSSILNYYDLYTNILFTKINQSKRNCFGAHNYLRIDKKGFYYTKWY